MQHDGLRFALQRWLDAAAEETVEFGIVTEGAEETQSACLGNYEAASKSCKSGSSRASRGVTCRARSRICLTKQVCNESFR